MRSRSLLAASLGAMVCWATLAGCSEAEPSDADKLTQVVGDPSLSATAAWQTSVPETLGYFEDEGIEVKVQPVDDTVTGAALVQAGKADVLQAGGPAMYQFAGDGPDNLVGVYVNPGHSYRVAVPADSPIRDASDLKGKAIGTTALSGHFYQYGRAVVQQGGLDADEDVSWLPVGLGAQAAAAFEDGSVDAYSGADFYNGLIGRILGVEMRDIAVPSNDLTGFGGWVLRRELVKEDPENVAGFVRATLKGMIFAFENPKAAVQIHWQAYPASRPTDWDEPGTLEFWAEMVKTRLSLTYDADGVWAGQDDLALIEEGATFQAENEMIASKPELESVIDLSLTDEYADFDLDEVRQQARTYKVDE